MTLKSKIHKLTTTISETVTVICCTISTIPVDAYNVQYTIDNDPSDSRFGSYNAANAFSYITANGLYNGDARSVASSTKSAFYRWTYPSCGQYGSSTLTVKVEAYLNHGSFTDPAAEYYVQLSESRYSKAGTIDQNKAKAGWNYISQKSYTSPYAGGGFISKGAEVWASGQSGYITGADAIRVTY